MGDLPVEPSDLDLLTASLRADTSDTDVFFEALGTKLTSVLGERVTLERGGGFLKRDSRVRTISVDLGDTVLTATKEKGRVTCQARRAVRGIVLKTEELDFDTWLRRLAQALADEAKRSEATRVALQSLLT